VNASALWNLVTPDGMIRFAVASARVTGLFFVWPVFPPSMLPLRIRVTAAGALSIALIPAIRAATLPADPVGIAIGLATELLIGAALGLTAAFFASAVSLAGDVLATEMGLSLASTADPSFDGVHADLARLVGLLAAVLYLAMDGHLVAVRALAASFEVLPPSQALSLERGAFALASMARSVFLAGVSLAAPVMAALFLANVGLAVLNRAVPQLASFMVALPVTIALGLVALGASLPGIGRATHRWVEQLPAQLQWVMAAFSGGGE
jgi:flagellar biosynthetic protein FliR